MITIIVAGNKLNLLEEIGIFNVLRYGNWMIGAGS
jgi:hypothetical protein